MKRILLLVLTNVAVVVVLGIVAAILKTWFVDIVVVGTALVRRVLETRSPEAAGELIGSFRDALDRG